MIAVVQRVLESYVEVEGRVVGRIGKGINVLLGISKDDTSDDIKRVVEKIINLRMFEDDMCKMNLSLLDVKGQALIISQFTLLANLKKGRRPSFENSMEPVRAKGLYEEFVREFSNYTDVQSGIFGADMRVFILNDGPVTFVIDSKNL